MPRKTDGIEFELHSSPQKDKNGKPLLYAKLASKKKFTFAQLEGYSISHKHMAKGELEACFTKDGDGPRHQVRRCRVHPLQGLYQRGLHQQVGFPLRRGTCRQQPDARSQGNGRGPAPQSPTRLHHRQDIQDL